MKNLLPPGFLTLLVGQIIVTLAVPLHGAITWPSVDRYTWNFDLGVGGASSSTTDTLAIQLDGPDRLVEPEIMLIRLYLGESSDPFYSRDWAGPSFGVNGLLYYPEAWTVPAGVTSGRAELRMAFGSVELRRITLHIATGTREYSASIAPNVRLVPEPATTLLVMTTGLLAFQRRRSTPGSNPGVNINHQPASF